MKITDMSAEGFQVFWSIKQTIIVVVGFSFGAFHFSFTRYLRNACREFLQIWHEYPLYIQILCFGGQRFSKGHRDLVSVPYLWNAFEGIGFKDDLIREILKLKSSVLFGSTCPNFNLKICCISFGGSLAFGLLVESRVISHVRLWGIEISI